MTLAPACLSASVNSRHWVVIGSLWRRNLQPGPTALALGHRRRYGNLNIILCAKRRSRTSVKPCQGHYLATVVSLLLIQGSTTTFNESSRTDVATPSSTAVRGTRWETKSPKGMRSAYLTIARSPGP